MTATIFDIDDPTTHPPVGAAMWHLHHSVDAIEFLTEPLVNRVAYIRAHKPADEIETRLRWLTPVQGSLPAASDKTAAAYVKARAASDKAAAASDKARAAYDKAAAASDKARAAYDKARAAYDKAWAAYVKARAAARPAIDALHAIEHPDCPWDGRTLFPEHEIVLRRK